MKRPSHYIPLNENEMSYDGGGDPCGIPWWGWTLMVIGAIGMGALTVTAMNKLDAAAESARRLDYLEEEAGLVVTEKELLSAGYVKLGTTSDRVTIPSTCNDFHIIHGNIYAK